MKRARRRIRIGYEDKEKKSSLEWIAQADAAEADATEAELEADALVDASGTFNSHNWIGPGGHTPTRGTER